jgi:hypothetical protein
MPESCFDFFNFTGIPIPDCHQKDPLTSQTRYPHKELIFKWGDEKVSVACAKPLKESKKRDFSLEREL